MRCRGSINSVQECDACARKGMRVCVDMEVGKTWQIKRTKGKRGFDTHVSDFWKKRGIRGCKKGGIRGLTAAGIDTHIQKRKERKEEKKRNDQ